MLVQIFCVREFNKCLVTSRVRGIKSILGQFEVRGEVFTKAAGVQGGDLSWLLSEVSWLCSLNCDV